MKRYISATYTMNFDNKFQVMEWLDYAQSRINRVCKKFTTSDVYYEVDDVSWGSDCFEIPIFKGDFTNPRNYRQFDKFRFSYDPDDVSNPGDPEAQLKDAIAEFLNDLVEKIDSWNRFHNK